MVERSDYNGKPIIISISAQSNFLKLKIKKKIRNKDKKKYSMFKSLLSTYIIQD